MAPEHGGSPNYSHGGGTYPNLFDAHPPFQIDGNFGGTAGVCEMLIQSQTNYLELLPALPDQWRKGSVSGLCARGGIEVNMSWEDGKVKTASFLSKKDGKVTIHYNGTSKNIKLKAGKWTKL